MISVFEFQSSSFSNWKKRTSVQQKFCCIFWFQKSTLQPGSRNVSSDQKGGKQSRLKELNVHEKEGKESRGKHEAAEGAKDAKELFEEQQTRGEMYEREEGSRLTRERPDEKFCCSTRTFLSCSPLFLFFVCSLCSSLEFLIREGNISRGVLSSTHPFSRPFHSNHCTFPFRCLFHQKKFFFLSSRKHEQNLKTVLYNRRNESCSTRNLLLTIYFSLVKK